MPFVHAREVVEHLNVADLATSLKRRLRKNDKYQVVGQNLDLS